MMFRNRNGYRDGWREAVAAAVFVAGVLAVSGCHGGSKSNQAAPSATHADTPRLFSIPQNQMAHIQVLTAERGTLTRSLSLTGTVAYNGFQTTPVISPIGGPVTRVAAVPGQIVRRGQPLLFVASPDYSQLLASYVKTRQAAELAQKSLARARDLYKHHAIAEQDLQTQTAAAAEAKGDLDASEAALRVLGVTDPAGLIKGQPSFQAPLRAPISGEVVERNISVGQLLQPGVTQCFLISNTGTVWVLVNIYQKDLPFIHNGDPVTIETNAYPESFHGKISYVAAALDPTTRTLPARIVTKNPGDKLKQGMYVTALVDAGALENAIAVPDSAVLRDSNNEPFLYVEQSGGQFARRLVVIGQSDAGKTQIVSGLEPGERYIAQGSLFVQFANSFE